MAKHKKKHPKQKTTAQRMAKRPRKTSAHVRQAGPPSGPADREPATRLEMEKVNRAMMRIIDAKTAEAAAEGRDPDAEMDKILRGMTGKTFDEIIALAGEPPPEERAQDLAYQAMDEDDPEEARRLAAQALEIDPFCMDALYIEALEDGEPTEALAERLRGALKKWEDHKGPEYFETHRGHFWGLIETRPYMRALGNLMDLLRSLRANDEAIAVCERCLELNESDNMEMRHALLGMYLQTGNMAGARQLFTKFDDESSAVFAWGKVLYHYLILDRAKARDALLAAMDTNPYFLPVFLDPDRILEKMDGYSPGEESEAVYCAEQLGFAWLAHKQALMWVIDQLETMIKSKRTKRRR